MVLEGSGYDSLSLSRYTHVDGNQDLDTDVTSPSLLRRSLSNNSNASDTSIIPVAQQSATIHSHQRYPIFSSPHACRILASHSAKTRLNRIRT